VALADDLLASERELGAGPGDVYRERLLEDAVVIVPGQVLDREACAAAIDDSPGWDDMELTEPRLVEPADGVATISYRFAGTRGDFRYEALMSSVYVRRNGAWKVALHQQTPLG